MNINNATQNAGRVAWTGTAATDIDIRNHIQFAFSFETTADIAADAVFNISAAPASDADPCLPGTYAPVPEIALCDALAVPGPEATITIPAGTKKGALCSATLPCRPNAFLKLGSEAGDTAKVTAVAILTGPR